MEFKAATCPSCAGALQVPTNRDVVKCMYCGKSVFVERAVKAAAEANLDNWATLAKTASDAGNWREAYDYYTRMLEYDPSNADAWMGKGRAAANLSTVAEPRLTEMCVAFQRALSDPTPDAATKASVANELHRAAIGLFVFSHKHLDQFTSVRQAWDQHVNACAQSLDALDFAQKLRSNDEHLTAAISICADVLRGRTFRVTPDASVSLWQLDDGRQAQLEGRLDAYLASVRKSQPNYRSPWLTTAERVAERAKKAARSREASAGCLKAFAAVAGVVIVGFVIITIEALISAAIHSSQKPAAPIRVAVQPTAVGNLGLRPVHPSQRPAPLAPARSAVQPAGVAHSGSDCPRAESLSGEVTAETDELDTGRDFEQAGTAFITCAQQATNLDDSYDFYSRAAAILDSAGHSYDHANSPSDTARAFAAAEAAARSALDLAKKGHGSVDDASGEFDAVHTDRQDDTGG